LLKNALEQSDMMLKRTAADGKYCEAVSPFTIMQEEATGLFYDAYIGPTKYHKAAMSIGASQEPSYDFSMIEKNTGKTAKNTDSIKTETANLVDGWKIWANKDQRSGVMAYGGQPDTSRMIQITQGMIDAARNSEDEYAQITMGLQPFAYGLAQFSAENGKFCQAISDFGLAQEYSGNFNPSYVGVNTGVYNQMKEAEAKYGVNSEQVQLLAEQLGISEKGQGLLNDTNEKAKETEKNTKEIAKNTGMTANVMGAMAYGSGANGGGSGLSGWGSKNIGGSYGTANGGWYTGGAAGLSAHLAEGSGIYGWGNDAVNANVPQYGSTGGYGPNISIGGFFAEGGFANGPTVMYGEEGREAFVPIADRAAGLRILPQVMAELGIKRFASGGFSGGSANIAAAIGGTSIGNITVINHANQPVDEKRLAREIVEKVAQAQYRAYKR